MSNLRVSISPNAANIKDDNGVGRVIHAQYKYLPQVGIELVNPWESPDVVASHMDMASLTSIDVLHCHGLYWTGDKGGEYTKYHHDANTKVIESVRRALVVTVPSRWVAYPFERDMRISPTAIGHGIDLDEWTPLKDTLGYLLWNKNRNTDVCDATPALELANRGFDVVSTFAPRNHTNIPENMRLVGNTDHKTMKELIRHAGIYLATTQETFGIGTIEALACGIPVLGYNHGGTADIVSHKVNGWLAEPGDIAGLVEGAAWIKANYAQAREAARIASKGYSWPSVASRYADVYREALARKNASTGKIGVVVTCYNYAEYIYHAIRSVLTQTRLPVALIVVDDGSTDSSLEVITKAISDSNASGVRIEVIQQQNQGVAAARNRGIDAASECEYVVCLDADDMISAGYLETTARALDADRGLGVAYTGLTIINADGSVWGPTGYPPEFDWAIQSKVTNPPSNCIPCAAMFRRDMWIRGGGYKQVYAPAEDTEFFTRGLSIGYRAKKVSSENLFLYRTHGSGAHVTKEYKPIDMWHPWLNDKRYPLGVPALQAPDVYSYAKPTISIIIPVGPNHAQYLPAAIDSVLGQTYRDWELIVVNDSGESLALPTYPFAKIVESNARHPGGSRNIGISQSKAPLVFFLDADDFIHPETLKLMLDAYLASDGSKYVYCDWVAYADGKATIQQTPEYSQTDWLETLPHSVTALIPKKWAIEIGGFDEKLPGTEEWDFYLKLALKGYCGVRVPEPLLGYRTTSGTIRKQSQANGDKLKQAILSRYKEAVMPGCCGGDAGQWIIDLKARGTGDGKHNLVPESSAVTLRFTGSQVGVQSFRSRLNKDRVYSGANDGVNNFALVHPDDVEYLLSLGAWARDGVSNGSSEAAAPIAMSRSLPNLPPDVPAPLTAPQQPAPQVVQTPAAPQVTMPDLAPDATPVSFSAGRPIAPFDIKELDGSALPEGVIQLTHDTPEPPKPKRKNPARRNDSTGGYLENPEI